MNKINFTNLIKSEILTFPWKEEALNYFLITYLRTNSFVKGGFLYVRVSFSKEHSSSFIELLQKTISLKEIEIINLNEKTNNQLFLIKDKNIKQLLNYDLAKIISQKEISKAYLAGLFLAKGLINSLDTKSYHLEIRIKEKKEAIIAQKAFKLLNLKINLIFKNNWYFLYLKKATAISDFLKSIYAEEALMIFEDERILRDIIANLKKAEAIKKHNQEKTLIAAKKQIEMINKLKVRGVIDKLPKKIGLLADLRLKHPESSIIELQYLYNSENKAFLKGEEITKSMIYSWLQIIIKFAKKGEESQKQQKIE